MEVSGIVKSIQPQEDGDLYILLELDDRHVDLTNAANEKYFQGNLVVNLVCQSLPSEEFVDEKASRCNSISQHDDIPVLGSHVVVTGGYILNRDYEERGETIVTSIEYAEET